METRKKNQGSDFYTNCLTVFPSPGQYRGKRDPHSALSASGELALMAPGAGRRKTELESWCKGLGCL